MRMTRQTLAFVVAIAVVGVARAADHEKAVCLQVVGEKVEVRNLTEKPIVIDRGDTPDFVTTSMMESVSTAAGSKSYNLTLSGVKRDAGKTIQSFSVTIDDKAYSYPKDACGK